jgi:hypothetical protein
MGKDKKPFTYTPGGIDLSEIRSPRMQRRICRNAAAEGVSTTPAPSTAANANSLVPPNSVPIMPPQIAVPVLPPPPPPPPQPSHQPQAKVSQPTPVTVKATPPPPQLPPIKQQTSQQQATISVRPPAPHLQQQQQQQNFQPSQNSIKNNVSNNSEAATINSINQQQNKKPTPTSIHIPAQINNNNNIVVVSQPGHIYVAPVLPKESGGGQLGSLYIPPVTQAPPSHQVQMQSSPPTPPPQTPGSPIHTALSKAPMPWMNSQNRQPPAQSPPVGVWSAPSPTISSSSQPTLQQQQSIPSNTRIIPIHVSKIFNCTLEYLHKFALSFTEFKKPFH